ncbi:RnfABCDGE type electron transport complex subunit D [Sphingobacterium sp. Mn56C]|uniref:RnfABCDGE type electron transport complex subunit D n=1 Tax=Sphingobacterium sp. Mn56C TaxID=3395261 RepID=UPI003BBA3DE7
MHINPFIRERFNTTQQVMLDVVIALLPVIAAAWLAYGFQFWRLLGIALAVGILTEFLFAALLWRKFNSLQDGSVFVTVLLLVCTLSPATPAYIVAFGAFAAVLFGKILWGGLGKNRFNPALVGREFMAVFFASTMTSAEIWNTADLVLRPAKALFPGIPDPYVADHLSALFYKPNGAMGEVSIVAIALAGVYLLVRQRISWHIPFSVLSMFTLCLWIGDTNGAKYAVGGILLATVFMATDMPSSPTTAKGKFYYGLMIGLVAFIGIKAGIRYAYMSYAILLMNAFSEQISTQFRPATWGSTRHWRQQVEPVFKLTGKILLLSYAVISLYQLDYIAYLLYIYIIYLLIKFKYVHSKKINHLL